MLRYFGWQNFKVAQNLYEIRHAIIDYYPIDKTIRVKYVHNKD